MAIPRAKQVPGEIVGAINGLPIRRMRVSDINAAHYNPRQITEKARSGLKASIDKFKLVEALVWNLRFQRLVGGHQRLSTMDPDSFTDVVQVDLDEVDEKALNLALNDRTKQGDWTGDVSELLSEIELKRPELFSTLALEDLRVEVPNLSPNDLPSDLTTTTSERAARKKTCPSCGHVF